MDATITIREASHDDLPAITSLNRAAVPAVTLLEQPEIERLVAASSVTLVADDGGVPVAFLVAFGPGADYDSPNYRFFADRYPAFQYVDRVVVAPEYKRHGIGTGLYDEVERRASEHDATAVTAEVNVRPANPASLAFHAARGFTGVGEQDTQDGATRVRLLVHELA